jgi:hypothetical protein
MALPPDQAPDAVQEVALLADQLRVEDAPLEMLAGEVLIETVGAGAAAEIDTAAECDALPPLPLQVSV